MSCLEPAGAEYMVLRPGVICAQQAFHPFGKRKSRICNKKIISRNELIVTMGRRIFGYEYMGYCPSGMPYRAPTFKITEPQGFRVEFQRDEVGVVDTIIFHQPNGTFLAGHIFAPPPAGRDFPE
jgi:hypothetical protein